MSHFGYKFIGKAPEIDAARRSTSDWYANLAQVSQLLCILAIPFSKFALTIRFKLRHGNKFNHNVETNRISLQTPNQEGKALKPSGASRGSESILDREVTKGYGTYEQWIFGVCWTAWLAFLCMKDTAPDYMHLVKRFGLIGASQLPIHYLLSMRHPYTPLRLLSQSSRRQLLPLHSVTGRVIIFFVALHAILYSNTLIGMKIFRKSIQQPKIAVALISVVIFGAIGATSMRCFRRKAYSWFYKVHIIGSTIVLPLLFFHVRHIRIYVLECAAVVGLNALFHTFGY